MTFPPFLRFHSRIPITQLQLIPTHYGRRHHGPRPFFGLLDKIFPGLTFLPYFAVLDFGVKSIFELWSGSITAHFISSVEMSAHDETYNYVRNWVSQNGISRDNYRLHASATLTNEGFIWSPDGDEKQEANRNDSDQDPLAKQISEMRAMSSLFDVKPIYGHQRLVHISSAIIIVSWLLQGVSKIRTIPLLRGSLRRLLSRV